MENEVNTHPLQMLQHCAKVDLKIGTCFCSSVYIYETLLETKQPCFAQQFFRDYEGIGLG